MMKSIKFASLTFGIVLLAGCAASERATGEVSEPETQLSAADVSICENVDPAMAAFNETVLAGAPADEQWAALNPIFMSADIAAIENENLVDSVALFSGVTLAPVTSMSEETLGTKVADLMFACEQSGSPLVETQAVLDSY